MFSVCIISLSSPILVNAIPKLSILFILQTQAYLSKEKAGEMSLRKERYWVTGTDLSCG